MAKVAQTLMDGEGKPVFEAIQGLVDKRGMKYAEGQLNSLIRGKEIQKEADLYEFANKHPELCPPIGASLVYISEYGVKKRVTVTMVLGGMPGTKEELLPLSEQPEHLQKSPELWAVQTASIRREKWSCWTDTDFYKDWQKIKGGK